MKRKLIRLRNKIMWQVMIKFVRWWSEHCLDQWEHVTVKTKFGEVYFTIEMETMYPESFTPAEPEKK